MSQEQCKPHQSAGVTWSAAAADPSPSHPPPSSRNSSSACSSKGVILLRPGPKQAGMSILADLWFPSPNGVQQERR